MKISVIGTLFNQKERAEKSLYIWLRQKDCPPYELIVLDDNSTDGSEYMIKNLQEEFPGRIKYYYFERPIPRSCTLLMNYGAKIADGEILVMQWYDRIPSSFYILKDINEKFNSIKTDRLFLTAEAWHIGTTNSQQVIPHSEVDALLNSISWREDPSSIKSISSFGNSNWRRKINESALFAMTKKMFIGMGGYDERYVMVNNNSNIDFFSKCKGIGLQIEWLDHQVFHIPHEREEGKQGEKYYKQWGTKTPLRVRI